MCNYHKMGWILLCLISPLFAIAQDISVVASTSFLEDMARELAPDHFKIDALVPLGGDPHTYEATPSDAQLAAHADLILLNGLTLEGWINELIENSGTTAPSILTTKGISPIQSLEYDNAVDPHAWMDLRNGKVYAQNIAHAFQQLAPEHEQLIQSKLSSYLHRMDTLHEWINQQIQKIPEEHRILITSHDAFQYYGRAYGLQLEAVLGTSTDAEVQTKDMLRLGNVIQESQVPAIFIESTLNPKLIRQIATDNNVKIGGELYADSLGPKNSKAHTYLDMLRHDTEVIVQALIGRSSMDTEEDKMQSIMQWIAYGMILSIMIGLFVTAYIKLS